MRITQEQEDEIERYFNETGLPSNHIAKLVGVSPATVSVRRQARNKELREKFDRDHGLEPMKYTGGGEW